jgi:hypothetical protein
MAILMPSGGERRDQAEGCVWRARFAQGKEAETPT